MTDGALAGREVPVESRVVVGRVDADLTIDDPLVSRRHAEVRQAEGALEIEDVGSLNGTWVNGERIAGSTRLSPGDVIRIGNVSIEVQADPVDRDRTVLVPAGDTEPGGRHEAAVPPRRESAAVPSLAARPEDEIRTVTALFAELVGLTALGERLSPGEVEVVAGECLARLGRTVERFGGVVYSSMADGIVALFGVPQAHEDDPQRAARTALSIVAEVRAYGREVEEAWGSADVGARVGINTGEAALGPPGDAGRQPVALGDTTSVADRLRAAADPGTIVVAEATARALDDDFFLEPLGEVDGGEPVTAWRLAGSRLVKPAAAEVPLVGREEELARLRGILDELAGGRGGILLVLGDAGIGKTRLVRELHALEDERALWLDGNCFSYGTETLYGPFIEVLRGWIGAEEGEPDLSVRTKLYATLEHLPQIDASDVRPYLARLLGLRVDADEEERLRDLPPGELGARLRNAYRAWVGALARQGPVVIAIEDLHWADPSSRALAEELLELCEQLPLLLVATLRVEPASEGWALRIGVLADHGHRAAEVRLAPLDDDAARALLRALPRSADVSEGDLELVVAGAEGNPFYLQELLRALAEGMRPRRELTWAPTATGARTLTPTLESLLVARIDALPPDARHLAQVAAVVGRGFSRRVLEHAAGADDVDEGLDALVRADVVYELRRHPEPEYAFRHGLLREAALSTLPRVQRRSLHRSVAVAFETLYADTLDDHLEVIAYYFARSQELPRALDYIARAAERAAGLDAGERAEELWGRALELAEKLGDAASQRRIEGRLAAFRAARAP